MTLTQFYKRLAKLEGKYQVLPHGSIRAYKNEVGYCPIVGVAKLKDKSIDSYYNGGILLGLSDVQVEKIINAADQTSPYSNPIRRSLLKALKLAEHV